VSANGEKAIPVFTSRERMKGYIRANLNDPKARMDMMEGGDSERARKLAEEGFGGGLMDVGRIAECAVEAEADWLMRDPRPGDEQEVLRVPK
jgi:hypothetical protein